LGQADELVITQNRTKNPCFHYYLALIKTAQNDLRGALELLEAINEPRSLGQLYPEYLKLNGFLEKQTGKL
jgi:hypothetical protein